MKEGLRIIFLDLTNYYFDYRSVAVPLGGIYHPGSTLPALVRSIGQANTGNMKGMGLKYIWILRQKIRLKSKDEF